MKISLGVATFLIGMAVALAAARTPSCHIYGSIQEDDCQVHDTSSTNGASLRARSETNSILAEVSVTVYCPGMDIWMSAYGDEYAAGVTIWASNPQNPGYAEFVNMEALADPQTGMDNGGHETINSVQGCQLGGEFGGGMPEMTPEP
jgi:hypothetical protein